MHLLHNFGNNADNAINYHARQLATLDGVTNFGALSTAEQNKYFLEAGSQIDDMAKNNHTALKQLNDLAGAAGITKDGSFSVKAQGMNFKNIAKEDCQVYNDYLTGVKHLNEVHSGKAGLFDEKNVVNTGNHSDLYRIDKTRNPTNPRAWADRGREAVDAAKKLF